MILNLNEDTYTVLEFNAGATPIDFGSAAAPLTLNSYQLELVFDDLTIPQFLTDSQARRALKAKQAYQLISSNLVKVTPPRTNITTNLSRAFSYFRRVF